MKISKVGFPVVYVDTHDRQWYGGLRMTIRPRLFTLRCGHWNVCLMRRPCKKQPDKGEWFK